MGATLSLPTVPSAATALPPVAHETYGTDARERRIAEVLTNCLRPLGRIARKFAAVR